MRSSNYSAAMFITRLHSRPTHNRWKSARDHIKKVLIYLFTAHSPDTHPRTSWHWMLPHHAPPRKGTLALQYVSLIKGYSLCCKTHKNYCYIAGTDNDPRSCEVRLYTPINSSIFLFEVIKQWNKKHGIVNTVASKINKAEVPLLLE